jgi:hypothetical protein
MSTSGKIMAAVITSAFLLTIAMLLFLLIYLSHVEG